MIEGGTGPATGTNATTCTPGAWNLHRMLQAIEGLPLNFGFLGKGNSSNSEALHDLLAVVPGALASASSLSSGVCAIRALTNDAHTLYRLLNRSRDLARRSLELSVPAREIW